VEFLGIIQMVLGAVLLAILEWFLSCMISMVIILALELAHSFGWYNIWVESDSILALRVFENSSVVPWDLRNHCSNCLGLGLNIASSHIYREGNICADTLRILVIRLPDLGGGIFCIRWDDFSHDMMGLLCYRLTSFIFSLLFS
jgi:hypothetical protein